MRGWRPKFLWVAAPASHLAIFRIILFSLLLGSADIRAALDWSNLALALRVPPVGMAWIAPWLPVNPPLVRAALVAILLTGGLSLIGLWTRVATCAAAILAGYVLAVPQLAGSVFHSHHLFWFAALLAASPCGDAISVDAWRRRSRGEPEPSPSVVYGLPIRIAWLLIGLIFFFPGLWKLRASGLAWAFSDNLRNLMYQKWFEFGMTPWLSFDRWPGLLHLAALGAMLFELSFVFLVFWRRTRWLAVGLALLFHLVTQLLTGISFSALWPIYTIFFLADGLPSQSQARDVRLDPVVAVGWLLIAGTIWAGVLDIEGGWPFACYPTFRNIARAELPWLEIEREDPSGSVGDVSRDDLAGQAGQRRWAEMWSVMRGGPGREARLGAYWQRLADERPGLRGAARVRFYAAGVSVLPEDHGRISRRQLIGEITP